MGTLVTGGTGFIGSRVIDALLQKGERNVSFSGRKRPTKSDFETRGARFHQGDLTDASFASKITRDVETIVHCAGLAGTWGSYDDFFRANVIATKNLLDGAKANGVRRFINISSPSIYFEFRDQLNLNEDYLPKKFSNYYAKTKWQAEQLVRSSHGPCMQTVSLRPRSVIGAGDQNVLPRLIRLQTTNKLFQVGKGENIVDITTIGNLLNAIFLCRSASDLVLGSVYNISNGVPIRFWDFVEMVLTMAELPFRNRRLPYLPVMAAAHANEFFCRILRRRKEPSLLPISIGVLSFSMTMDISRASKSLGYYPRFSTEDGVREFIESRRAPSVPN